MNGFQNCEICGQNEWRESYIGPIRNGRFGELKEGATIALCSACGVGRLNEAHCIDSEDYEIGQYRSHLGQQDDAHSHYALHDMLQYYSLRAFWPNTFRNKIIADVGAASGSFLDAVSGLAERLIAVEPCQVYHPVLKEKGYDVYSYASNALTDYAGKINIATSFQVIEHVTDPRVYLEEIRDLLKPDGILMISTPNLNDILMKTVPEIYTQFFYRAAHRWYFDESSLTRCVELAGMKVHAVKYAHRYPLSNYLRWLRDAKPTGRESLPEIDKVADGFWCSYLESNGLADTLFVECGIN
ncbi:MAG: methyltransferase [marine bacterium B5-7]|nr:MAG: methyltransferase [marine bacterium B5-7]